MTSPVRPPDRPRRSAAVQILATVGIVALVLAVVLIARMASAPVAQPDAAPPGPDATATRTPAPARPTTSTPADQTRDPVSGLTWVALDRLPREAVRTVTLIERGGPFPYAKDGASFANRERILPRQRSGYYREYTVPTPGSRDRGARRIVSGSAGELFWTADRYDSFARIRR